LQLDTKIESVNSHWWWGPAIKEEKNNIDVVHDHHQAERHRAADTLQACTHTKRGTKRVWSGAVECSHNRINKSNLCPHPKVSHQGRGEYRKSISLAYQKFKRVAKASTLAHAQATTTLQF